MTHCFDDKKFIKISKESKANGMFHKSLIQVFSKI